MKCIKIFVTLFFVLFFYDSVQGQVVIEMEKDGGVYKVPCKVNGLKLKFIFDTGASSVCLSGAVADMMLENGYLDRADIVGSGKSSVADGRIVNHTVINIKEIEIAGLTLKNVEAVVMHQQSAPLLLGQSAIQKLGKVVISGNKLIVSSYGAKNPYMEQKSYSDEDYAEFRDEANSYFDGQNYDLAVERYELLYNSGEIYLKDIWKYAESLRSCTSQRYEDALDVLLKNEKDVLESKSASKRSYYEAICIAAYWAKEYNLCIRYGELVKVYAEGQIKYPLEHRWYSAIYWIASSYKAIGKEYQAKREVSTFITEYLNFMEIEAMDCWDKKYEDDFLGDLYHVLGLISGENMYDGKKYYIIAAAWGCKGAIEICENYDWRYNTKPYDYVY